MKQITKADLEIRVGVINRMTKNPVKPYSKTGDKFTANVGNYHLAWAYGGVCLHRMQNEGGGVEVIIHGYSSKRELYEKMGAYIAGLEASRDSL